MIGSQLEKQLLSVLRSNHSNSRVFVVLETGEKLNLSQVFRSTVDTDLSDLRAPFLAVRADSEEHKPITVKDLYESVLAVKELEKHLFPQMEVSVLHEQHDPYDDYPIEYQIEGLMPAFSLRARKPQEAALCY